MHATVEQIDGDRFLTETSTDFLADVRRRLAGGLVEALGDASGRLVANPRLALAPGTTLMPDLAVSAAEPGDAPLLVVEVRRESTDRFALGPKRLAYARAGVAEYWFADPVHGAVLALRHVPGERDYPWPPAVHRHGDVIASAALGADVPVDRLLPPVPDRFAALARAGYSVPETHGSGHA